MIAMANSGDSRFLPMLQQLCSDEDPVVAEHARWGVKRLAVLQSGSSACITELIIRLNSMGSDSCALTCTRSGRNYIGATVS